MEVSEVWTTKIGHCVFWLDSFLSVTLVPSQHLIVRSRWRVLRGALQTSIGYVSCSRHFALLCFSKPILGNRYSPGVIPVQGTWGGWILTLHLNDIAGYTDPLLFLFERTQQLLHWQPGACALAAPSSGQVQSSFGLIGESPQWWKDLLDNVVPRSAKSSNLHNLSKVTLVFWKQKNKKMEPEGETPALSQVRIWELLSRDTDDLTLLWEFRVDTTGLNSSGSCGRRCLSAGSGLRGGKNELVHGKWRPSVCYYLAKGWRVHGAIRCGWGSHDLCLCYSCPGRDNVASSYYHQDIRKWSWLSVYT